MKFYSTKRISKKISFKEAVFKGIADDGGLFMPEFIPVLPEKFFKEIDKYSFLEICFEVANAFIGDEIPDENLKSIINNSISFDAPLVNLNADINILELFHGPTLAFKDFGARFMAEVVSFFSGKEKKNIVILVATSGDTGSAVANGFLNVDGIKVNLLYPSGKVSFIQEKQLTTLGNNITALEIDGTFDDCQHLVKTAFADNDLKNMIYLTSANSINIARLIPQSFYYFNAYRQLKNRNKLLIVSVPSGNFGNLTGGLIAKRMGLPVNKFIAAVNSNNVFCKFLETGKFIPKPSVKTISNAMDVGNPSNFYRLYDLYSEDLNKIKTDICSFTFSDKETKEIIQKIYDDFNYLIDPHGAVGFLALNKFISENNIKDYNGIILETAHPSKFADVIEEILDVKVEIPERLQKSLSGQKQSFELSNNYEAFKNFLLNQNKR